MSKDGCKAVRQVHNKLEEITRLSKEGLVQKLSKYPEDYEKRCIPYNPGRTGLMLEGVLTLLRSMPVISPLYNNTLDFINAKYFANLLLVIGEQENHILPWSSENNVRKSKEIVEEICRIFTLGSRSIKEIILIETRLRAKTAKPKYTILNQAFKNLHSKLTPDDWKYYPAAEQAYHWLVLLMRRPHLGDSLQFTLPPVILFIEENNDEHILVGLVSLGHLIRHVTKDELLMDGRAELIFKTLNKLFRKRDPRIIDSVMPEMIKTLSVLEKNSPHASREFTRYDIVMKNILNPLKSKCSTETVAELAISKNWLRHLAVFLEVFGISTLHWSDSIIGILRDFINCNDPAFLHLILECTQLCIKYTWPRLDSDSLSEIIIKIVFNTSVTAEGFTSLKAAQRHMIYDKARETYALLMACPDANVERIRTQMKEIVKNKGNCLNAAFVSVLATVVLPPADGEKKDKQEKE